MSSQVLAVVPSYRPDAGDLLALVDALASQGVPVLVADDAGIARGLNDGLALTGAQWLLTVDQDSPLPEDYVARLLDAAAHAVRVLGIGGFDETLGIDAVDSAACLRMRAQGRHAVLVPGRRITHRVGAGRRFTVLGRRMLASGHSPERRTTMVRNRLRLAPEEFAQSPKHALRTLRRLLVNTALGACCLADRGSVRRVKGIILAGGAGSRLWPITMGVSK